MGFWNRGVGDKHGNIIYTYILKNDKESSMRFIKSMPNYILKNQYDQSFLPCISFAIDTLYTSKEYHKLTFSSVIALKT